MLNLDFLAVGRHFLQIPGPSPVPDRILRAMYETGHFAARWQRLATRLGLHCEVLTLGGSDEVLPNAPGWRRGVQVDKIETRLRQDTAKTIRAVRIVHNEPSNGVTSDIASVRKALDAAGHPALLMVDTISGLACAD